MDNLTIQRLGHIRHQEIIAEASPSDAAPRAWVSGLRNLLNRVRHLKLPVQTDAGLTQGDSRVQQGSVPGQ